MPSKTKRFAPLAFACWMHSTYHRSRHTHETRQGCRRSKNTTQGYEIAKVWCSLEWRRHFDMLRRISFMPLKISSAIRSAGPISRNGYLPYLPPASQTIKGSCHARLVSIARQQQEGVYTMAEPGTHLLCHHREHLKLNAVELVKARPGPGRRETYFGCPWVTGNTVNYN